MRDNAGETGNPTVLLSAISSAKSKGEFRRFVDLSSHSRLEFVQLCIQEGLPERVSASIGRGHLGLTVASGGNSDPITAYICIKSSGNHRAEIVLTPSLVLTRREGRLHGFSYAFGDDPGSRAKSLLDQGTDFLVWAMLDAIVDSYDRALDRFAERLETLEERLVRADSRALDDLLEHKREVLALRSRVSLIRESVNGLLGYEGILITAASAAYWRDLYGSVVRIGDLAEAASEQASMAMNLHLTSVNNALAATMKRMTGVTALLALAGALAGIFGMSEAAVAIGGEGASGFWFVAGGIAALSIGVGVLLRRSGWL